MGISDWSSDVCSSDLGAGGEIGDDAHAGLLDLPAEQAGRDAVREEVVGVDQRRRRRALALRNRVDRKSVVWGESVSVRVVIGVGRIFKKTRIHKFVLICFASILKRLTMRGTR